jgi:hypothetical protein
VKINRILKYKMEDLINNELDNEKDGQKKETAKREDTTK